MVEWRNVVWALLLGLLWGYIATKEYHFGGPITSFWKGLAGQ